MSMREAPRKLVQYAVMSSAWRRQASACMALTTAHSCACFQDAKEAAKKAKLAKVAAKAEKAKALAANGSTKAADKKAKAKAESDAKKVRHDGSRMLQMHDPLPNYLPLHEYCLVNLWSCPA